MAQCISTWEKMIEDDLQEAKYRELYGHPDACQGEKTRQLREIIELQYDINGLLGQKQHLERTLGEGLERKGRGEAEEELYRMVVMQAMTLEQFCGL